MANEDQDVVAVCTECRTVMTDSKAYADKFLQEGKSAACKMCGGVIAVMYRAQLDKTLKKIDDDRGI